MRRKFFLPVIAGGLLAFTLTGCATIPAAPTLYPVQYPMFAPPPSVQPSYVPPAIINDPPVMQAQVPPPSVDYGGTSSWERNLAVAGAGAGLGIAGTQLARKFGGRAAEREAGVVAGGVARSAAGLIEREEGAAALGGLMDIIIEDWWLFL